MKHFRDSEEYGLSSEDMHESTIKHFKDVTTGSRACGDSEKLSMKKAMAELMLENKALHIALDGMISTAESLRYPCRLTKPQIRKRKREMLDAIKRSL